MILTFRYFNILDAIEFNEQNSVQKQASVEHIQESTTGCFIGEPVDQEIQDIL